MVGIYKQFVVLVLLGKLLERVFGQFLVHRRPVRSRANDFSNRGNLNFCFAVVYCLVEFLCHFCISIIEFVEGASTF